MLLVGAGCVARAKLRVLASTGAKIRVVARHAAEDFEAEAAAAGAELILRAVRPADLAGTHLVVSATNDPEVNARLALEAKRRGIWICAVDDPPSCDAFFASQITAGPLHLALSSHGRLPGLMRALRLALEELMPQDHHDPLRTLAELRRELKRLPDPRRRAEALRALAEGLRAVYLPG